MIFFHTPKKYEWHVLAFLVLLYASVVSLVCLFFYKHNLYLGLDLGIYNQSLWNTVHGMFFKQSLTNTFYFGDHLELILLFVAPVYYFFSGVPTLLIIQTFVIATGAVPLYLIAKNKFSPRVSFIFVLGYFLYGPVISVNLYDFHAITFAIPLLLWVYYFFVKEKFLPFLVFVILSLLIREDVALIISLFGVYAFINKKGAKWIFVPLLLGGGYFFAAIKLITYFNHGQYDNYKYFIYYKDLGNTLGEIIINGFLHPQLLLERIFDPLILSQVFLVLFILITPLGFLLLFDIPLLVFFLPFLIQLYATQDYVMANLVMHRLSLFIPFIFVATVNGFQRLQKKSLYIEHRYFILFVIFSLFIVSNIAFSQIPYLPAKINTAQHNPVVQFENDAVGAIPSHDPVLATAGFLPKLSSREYVYESYVIIQNSSEYQRVNQGFSFPKEPSFALIDFTRFSWLPSSGDRYPEERHNLQTFFSKYDLLPVRYGNSTILFQQHAKNPLTLFTIHKEENFNTAGLQSVTDSGIYIQQISKKQPIISSAYTQIPLDITFVNTQAQNNTLSAKFNITSDHYSQEIVIPLGYYIYATDKWGIDEAITHSFNLITTPNLPPEQLHIALSIINSERFMTYSYDHPFEMLLTHPKDLGNVIEVQ